MPGGYPWSTGDELFAADLNAAIAYGLSATITLVSDSPPTGALDNVLWWDSRGTGLYIRYNDGNSSQWVATQSQNTLTDAPSDGNTYGRLNSTWTPLTNWLLLTGGTVTGPTTFSAAGTGLSVTNNATIGGTLGVTGVTTLGAVTVGGKLNVHNIPLANADGSPPAGTISGDIYNNGGFLCVKP